jgi:dTDP-4-amino-4,6-dideoxygalactose transaminase
MPAGLRTRPRRVSKAPAPTARTAPASIPCFRPAIGEEEIAAATAALRSGWLTTGPKAREFEQKFAAFMGDGVEAVAVNSATAGLHLAAEACGIGPGDEVIVPTLTFTATASVIRYLGAEVVLVDVEERTRCIDLDDAERRLTPRCKAIIPVHFGGLPCDMTKVLAFARRYGLKVIEDAARLLGIGCLRVQLLRQQANHHWRRRHDRDARS